MRDPHFVHGTFEAKPESLPFPPSKKEGVSFLRGGAVRYSARRGQSYSPEGLDEVQHNSRLGVRIAREYEAAPSAVPDERVRHAYDAFRNETNEQFDYLTKPRTAGGLGITVEIGDEEPYPSHKEMTEDIKTNRRLKVLSSKATGGHPLLSDEENDRFRATHDAFAHAAVGRSFTRHGEEAAFRSHAQMYSPDALPALTTETRGQNSTMLWGKGGGFPEQKPVLLPEWASHLKPSEDEDPAPGRRSSVSRGIQESLF